MADYTSRTVTTVRREYIVPAPSPHGAAAAEVDKAWNAAQQEYREKHNVPAETSLHDNALQFFPADDAIVIAFTVEETQQ
ncbi:hypothetical protein [Streptomyces synnematoformans]|uniref:Uncharacterized protein n=1 Tax=Streptomyces synnematoformans TaxID=415721 RepID=A0ABN2XAD4_9ACTN